jgi:glycosyltransferase involved in cell wall biosynthesis
MVTHHHLDRNAGAAGATLDLAEALRAADHDVDVFSLEDASPRTRSARTRDLQFGFASARYLRRAAGTGTDVVDAACGDAWPWSSRRPAGRPVLVTRVHGLEHVAYRESVSQAARESVPLSRAHRLYRGRIRLGQVTRSLRQSDTALFLNEGDRAYAIERLGVAAERTEVIPNGLPKTLLAQPAPDPSPLRRIAILGGYFRTKGSIDAERTLDVVLRHAPELSVSFLGTGCTQDEVLAAYAPELHDRIVVIPRFEAMACGLAPVAARNAGAVDLIDDGVNGLLTAIGDPPAGVAALERLVAHPDLLHRLRTAAQSSVQGLSWTAIAERMLSVYERALARRR